MAIPINTIPKYTHCLFCSCILLNSTYALSKYECRNCNRTHISYWSSKDHAEWIELYFPDYSLYLNCFGNWYINTVKNKHLMYPSIMQGINFSELFDFNDFNAIEQTTKVLVLYS